MDFDKPDFTFMFISNQRVKSKAIFVLSEEDRPGKEKWVGKKNLP